MLALVLASKATNTSISAIQASLDAGNTTADSIKRDLHAVLPQKEDIRDLMTVTQRTMNSVFTGSEKTEQQYSTLAITLSALSVSASRQSELERADMQRIETKLDQFLKADMLNVQGEVSDSELAHR